MDKKPVVGGMSQREGQLYSDGNGFFYRVKQNRSYAKWALFCHNSSCPGTADLLNPNSVDNDKCIVHKAPHNCQPNKRLLEVIELKKRIMQRCRDEDTNLRQIFNEEMAKSDEEVASFLSWEGIESNMFRARNKEGNPPEPESVDAFVLALDDSERFNDVYEQTYLSGVVEDGEDIAVIFMVKPLSTPFTEATDLYLDASFTCVPKAPKFERLLSLMAVHEGFAFPVVFCLMTKGSGSLYDQIFAHLKENLPDLSPKHFIGDAFNPVLKDAVSKSFPLTKFIGSFYHYGQSILQKMQKLGLLQLFKANMGFNKVAYMTVALAHLPPEKVEDGLKCVEKFFHTQDLEKIPSNENAKIKKFFRYVRTHWIGEVGVDQFSVHGQQERTGDCHEQLHRRLLLPLGKQSSPNIWTFQRNLVSIARQSVSDFMQLNTDPMVRQYRRIKWLLLDSKIRTSVLKLKSSVISVSQFLSDVSSKCTMHLQPVAETGSDDEDDGCNDNDNDDDYCPDNSDQEIVTTKKENKNEVTATGRTKTRGGLSGLKRRLLLNDDGSPSPQNNKKPCTEQPAAEVDACEKFGKNVASKLRIMTKHQRLVAEKIINDTLFFGELDKLTLQFATQYGSSLQDLDDASTAD
ncbi:uncharacterized protein LOC111043332 [Nilaparvata lugens]|uniref:uncharacterized protein LOC111043332 n=1 Tax=Nilaparvata lugens TaxID=108931 RepID=UPI00193E525E|nr:uncharacterized protein LOC111043332 [Nilaparvata lugens]XP_022183940.2 uncharacterized protein LOC111043332 [Nilaparvata lugens]